jgi:hypothetical protein
MFASLSQFTRYKKKKKKKSNYLLKLKTFNLRGKSLPDFSINSTYTLSLVCMQTTKISNQIVLEREKKFQKVL